MKHKSEVFLTALAKLAAAAFLAPHAVHAQCDGMNAQAVKAARTALREGDCQPHYHLGTEVGRSQTAQKMHSNSQACGDLLLSVPKEFKKKTL
jgi:hypothetical protein